MKYNKLEIYLALTRRRMNRRLTAVELSLLWGLFKWTANDVITMCQQSHKFSFGKCAPFRHFDISLDSPFSWIEINNCPITVLQSFRILIFKIFTEIYVRKWVELVIILKTKTIFDVWIIPWNPYQLDKKHFILMIIRRLCHIVLTILIECVIMVLMHNFTQKSKPYVFVLVK